MLIGVRIIGLAPQRARRRSVWAAGYQPVQLAPLRAQHLAPLRPICELLLGVGRGGAAPIISMDSVRTRSKLGPNTLLENFEGPVLGCTDQDRF